MGNIAKNAFPVLNMHCAGCASNVEKTVKKQADAESKIKSIEESIAALTK